MSLAPFVKSIVTGSEPKASLTGHAIGKRQIFVRYTLKVCTRDLHLGSTLSGLQALKVCAEVEVARATRAAARAGLENMMWVVCSFLLFTVRMRARKQFRRTSSYLGCVWSR